MKTISDRLRDQGSTIDDEDFIIPVEPEEPRLSIVEPAPEPAPAPVAREMTIEDLRDPENFNMGEEPPAPVEKQLVADRVERATAVVPRAPSGYRDIMSLADKNKAEIDVTEGDRVANIIARVPIKFQAQAIAFEKQQASRARAVIDTYVAGLGKSAFSELGTTDKFKAEQLSQTYGLDLVRSSDMAKQDSTLRRVTGNAMNKFVNDPERYAIVENKLFGKIVTNPSTGMAETNPSNGRPLRVGGLVQPNDFGVLEVTDQGSFDRVLADIDAADKYERSIAGINRTKAGSQAGTQAGTQGGSQVKDLEDISKMAQGQMTTLGNILKDIPADKVEMIDPKGSNIDPKNKRTIVDPRRASIQARLDAAQGLYLKSQDDLMRASGIDVPMTEPASQSQSITMDTVKAEIANLGEGRSDSEAKAAASQYLKSTGAPIIKGKTEDDRMDQLFGAPAGVVVVEDEKGNATAQNWVGKEAWAEKVYKQNDAASLERRISSTEKEIEKRKLELRRLGPIKFNDDDTATFDLDQLDSNVERARGKGTWGTSTTADKVLDAAADVFKMGGVRKELKDKNKADMDAYNQLVTLRKSLRVGIGQLGRAKAILKK